MTHRQPQNTAEPLWLGRFVMSSDNLCQGECGRLVVARAAWVYRGKVLVLELCETCCALAEQQSVRRVSMVHELGKARSRERVAGGLSEVRVLEHEQDRDPMTFEDNRRRWRPRYTFSMRRPSP